MTNKKPLARWTLGPVSSIGHEILLESIQKFKKIYPEFDCILCFNNINPDIVEKFRPYVDLYQQKKHELPCPVLPPNFLNSFATGCGWKLSPPRLRIKGLELFLDNDLVIFDRIKEIDDWINSGRHGIITEGKQRLFGAFSEFIKPNYKLCAGFFGLPPFFNFEKHIKYYFEYFKQPLDAFDEQGLSAAVVSNMKNFIIVPLSKVAILEDHLPFPDIKNSEIGGIHFVGANRQPWHRGWLSYKNIRDNGLLC